VTRPRTVTMPALHVGQEKVRLHPARFKVLPCGRRWGKTRLVEAICNAVAISRNLPAWWIWPSHVIAKDAWKGTHGLLDWGLQLQRAGFQLDISKVDRALYYPGGGYVAMRSADDPDALVGAGLGLAVFDECGLHQVRSWDESVRPALSDNVGDALFVGVPRGRQGLLWHAHQMAQDPDATDWAEFPATTPDNPLFPKAEWASLVADHEAGRISDRYFRQQYLAEFLGDHGAVFERVVEMAVAPHVTTRPDGAFLVLGIDWGRSNDATVFSLGNVACTPLRQVALERIVGRSYDEQLRRLSAFVDHWKPDLIVPERNSMGGPLCEEIAGRGWPVFYGPDGEPGFHTNPGTKRPLIEQYAHAFRTGEIEILPDPVQITEHQAYEVKQLSTGYMTFSAPKNEHDDTVIAGALWVSAAMETADWGAVVA